MSIDSVLLRQGGVITRRQATAAGLSPDAVDLRLRRRQWQPLHPRVYLAGSRVAHPEARLRAALLWAGDGAVLAGAAAAWWFGLLPSTPPSTITITVPGRPPRPRPGVRLRRRELAAVDVVEHRGLRLTARPLTVLEAAVELGAAGGPWLDRALQGRLSWSQLHAAHRRHPSASAHLLLDAAAERSAAVARQLLVRLLREAGATGWRAGGPGFVATFPDARLAIVVTGWAGPEPAPPADPGPGWTVLRIDWPDLVARPPELLARIAAVAGRR